MNNYPRKILNGDSPFETMAKEFAELAENPKIKGLFLWNKADKVLYKER